MSFGRLVPLVKIHLIKLLVFVALLGGFYAFGGFERPAVSQDDYRSSPRMVRAWLVTVIMFIAGAVLAIWGNNIAQMVDWDVPDGLYPIIGVLLLLAGLIWMLIVRDSTRRPNKPAAGNAGLAPWLAIQHLWSGVPEPERWAALRIWPFQG